MSPQIQSKALLFSTFMALQLASPVMRAAPLCVRCPQVDDRGGSSVNPELAARKEMKRHFTLKSEAPQYVWSYSKQIEEYGVDTLEFQNIRSLNEVSGGLAELMSKPWYSIYRGNKVSTGSAQEHIAFDRLPILKMHVIDIKDINFYHQTSFPAVEALVTLGSESVARGSLNTDQIRFSNQDTNPSFFTHVDPGNSIQMDLASRDALLKVNIKNKKDVFMLELYQPVSDEQVDKFFEILTGNKDYWADYQKTYKKGNQYDFDLYENAVIKALRDIYHIPVDVTLYVKDYDFQLMGIPSRNVFSWGIVHDRELLRGSLVPVIFDGRLSVHHPTRGNGVDESQYPPLTLLALDLYLKYPTLRAAMETALTSTNVSKNPDVAKKLRRLRDQQIFWGANGVYSNFTRELFKADSPYMEELSQLLAASGFSEDRISAFLGKKMVEFWDQTQAKP